MRRAVLLGGLLLLLGWGGAAGQSDPPADSPLDRAEALLVAGDLEGARRALADASPADSVEVDAITGLIELRSGHPAAAAERFRRVLALRPNRLGVWVYLGQAHYVMGDYASALAALHEGESVGVSQAGYFILRARTERELNYMAAAEETLVRGRERFPDAASLMREYAFFHLDLGLVTDAQALAERYRERAPGDPYAWRLVADIARRTGEPSRAADVLERARLRLPGESELTTQLAHVYAELGVHGPAGELFASVADRDSAAALAAADQFRLAGRFREALRWNAQVRDETLRQRQRIAILVADGSHDRALAFAASDRASVTAETALLLAHAAVRVGRFRDALDWVAAITDPALAARAESLRRIAADCDRVDVDCTGLAN